MPTHADHVTLPAIKPSKQQQWTARGLSPTSNTTSPEPYHAAAGILQHPQDLLQLPARQHKTVPACTLANPSTSAAAGGIAGIDQHALATRLLHASRNSRASTSSRRVSSSSHASSRPRTQQQQQEEQDDASISAQQQLEQLYGHSSSRPELEAAAGARIMALPFAICTAADGSLFEVATG